MLRWQELRLGVAALIALFGLIFCTLATAPAMAAKEEILSYKSTIHINADASLTVTEVITVRALGRQIKRGIYRDFPTTYKDRFNNTVKVPLKVLQVTRNGQPLNYWVERRGNGNRVYMGRKDKFINTGVHSFALTYIGFFDSTSDGGQLTQNQPVSTLG